jgi:hypothetical protein
MWKKLRNENLNATIPNRNYDRSKTIGECGIFQLPYILESNLHPVFGDFLNEKKLVRESNPHLSFNHPLPMGRLIE